MKAAILRAPDSAPEYGDFAEPVVGAGKELVQLVAAGIHPLVRSLARGRHYGSTGTWPLIPGVDAVARNESGALIYTGYVEAPYGTMAERMAVPVGLPLPAGADPVQIAGGLNPGLSSWMPLTARAAEVKNLGTVLVLGASGMAGVLAIQNALVLGATRVVGAGRSPQGLSRAGAAGATTVALRGDRDKDSAALVAALGDTTPSLVLDYIWAASAEACFAALQRHGLDEDTADISYVQIGAMAGPEAAVPASLLRSRHLRISGSGAGSASTADLMSQLSVYMRLIADHRVEVMTRAFPLSEIASAWEEAAKGGPRPVLVPG